MASSNQSLNSHAQLQSIQNCYAKFGLPILKNSCFFFYFFFTAKASVHVNRFIAYFYYSRLLAWC